MSKTKWLVVACGIVILTACGYAIFPTAPLNSAELCGTYVYDGAHAHDELTLREDGTFTERATIKASQAVAKSNGTWSYSTRVSSGLRFGDVHFHNGLLQVVDGAGGLNPEFARPPEGISIKSATIWWGRVVLGGADSWPAWTKIN